MHPLPAHARTPSRTFFITRVINISAYLWLCLKSGQHWFGASWLSRQCLLAIPALSFACAFTVQLTGVDSSTAVELHVIDQTRCRRPVPALLFQRKMPAWRAVVVWHEHVPGGRTVHIPQPVRASGRSAPHQYNRPSVTRPNLGPAHPRPPPWRSHPTLGPRAGRTSHPILSQHGRVRSHDHVHSLGCSFPQKPSVAQHGPPQPAELHLRRTTCGCSSQLHPWWTSQRGEGGKRGWGATRLRLFFKIH